MTAKQPNDYTVLELKELLRERNLPSSGNKSELVTRLTSFDPNVWSSLDEERIRQAQDLDRSVGGNGSLQDGVPGEENGRHIQDGEIHNVASNVPLSENDLIRRENKFLKRERALLQRELEITRQQSTESRGSARSSVREGRPTGNENIRVIRDLLSEFDGSEGMFWKWEQQIRLLKITYALDDGATRILMSSKLKGRALE